MMVVGYRDVKSLLGSLDIVRLSQDGKQYDPEDVENGDTPTRWSTETFAEGNQIHWNSF